MTTTGPQRLVESLTAADPDVADRDQIVSILRDTGRLRAWLDALEVRCARRSRALAAEGRAEPAVTLIGADGRRSAKEARGVADREATCDQLPAFEASLESGEVSSGHVDALSNAMRGADDAVRDELVGLQDELVVAAAGQRVDEFERTCRDLVRHLNALHAPRSDIDELERQRSASRIKRWVDRTTGMHHTHAELDPVRDAKLRAALDAHLRRIRRGDPNAGRPFHELEVDAFVAAFSAGVTRRRSGEPTSESSKDRSRSAGRRVVAVDDPPAELRVPEITLLVDQATIEGRAHERSVCETADGTPLPVETVRRLACDAEVLPAVLNGRGEVTDLGRSSRTVTRPQRRRLRAMHRTCIRPGCAVPFERCEIHHVRHWTAQRGPTDIANLVPLCSRDHHLVHEGGWTLTMTPDRIATWTRPDGTVHHVATTIDRAPVGVALPNADVEVGRPAGPGDAPPTGTGP